MCQSDCEDTCDYPTTASFCIHDTLIPQPPWSLNLFAASLYLSVSVVRDGNVRVGPFFTGIFFRFVTAARRSGNSAEAPWVYRRILALLLFLLCGLTCCVVCVCFYKCTCFTMWGPQTDYRPHGAYRQSGFLPLIPNTHMVRNQNRYSYGGYSYNPFSAYSMGSPSQNYSNYVVQPGYQSRNFSRIPSMHGGGDYYGGQWNGYYRDRSVREVNPSAAHDVVLGGGGGTHLFNGPQRNASFSKAQMTRNPTWMWPSIQRRGNGGFTHPEFQRYDSFPHAHTGLQREASFGRKPIPRVDSFGVDSVARSDSFSSDRSSNSLYEMGYPSQTSGLNRSTSAASPDPSLSSEEEGLASLLRKQSALHRGETLGCQSEHIGRRSGGLMFKGVEVEK